MKKFSRCSLILLLVLIVSAITSYFYFDNSIKPVFSSVAKLYVVPGSDNEASVRADDGGLNDDFMIIFKSDVVISSAKSKAGTSEDIGRYITVSSPENSNIVEIKCTNPDKNTAKKYVDAVAATAIKTTSIIPVKSIQILSEGTLSDVYEKPELYKKVFITVCLSVGIAFIIELIVLLFMAAFKSNEKEDDDELEYEKKFGKYAVPKDLVTKREMEEYCDEKMKNISVELNSDEEKRSNKDVQEDSKYIESTFNDESVDDLYEIEDIFGPVENSDLDELDYFDESDEQNGIGVPELFEENETEEKRDNKVKILGKVTRG